MGNIRRLLRDCAIGAVVSSGVYGAIDVYASNHDYRLRRDSLIQICSYNMKNDEDKDILKVYSKCRKVAETALKTKGVDEKYDTIDDDSRKERLLSMILTCSLGYAGASSLFRKRKDSEKESEKI